MKLLQQNIIGIYGDKGRIWLEDLPNKVKILTEHWKLRDVFPVDNLTFNYVVKATSNAGEPLVMKISCDDQVIKNEKLALEHFKGHGSIKFIDYNEEYNAILIEQAIPGISIKSLYPKNVHFVIDSYVSAMQKLHTNLLKENTYPHIKSWLEALDKVKPGQLPLHLLQKAKDLKNELLETSTEQIFLHGDLHLDNMINNNDEWLAIDPKGIVGEPEFEAAAFDFIHSSEMNGNVKSLLNERVNYFSKKSDLDASRLKSWIFVRIILSAAWWLEDNGDPTYDIEFAQKLF